MAMEEHFVAQMVVVIATVGKALSAFHLAGEEFRLSSDHQLSNCFATHPRVSTVSRERVAPVPTVGKTLNVPKPPQFLRLQPAHWDKCL
jgi:hypothetical protein